MKTVCVDSGFIIGLYDETDSYHSVATGFFVAYFENTENRLLIPWPILYETVSTRMVKNRKRLDIFKRDWQTFERQKRLILLDDQEFRQDAIDECLAETNKLPQHYRSLSLADRVVRNILADKNIKIDLFITFNIGDFKDVCQRSGRIIVPV